MHILLHAPAAHASEWFTAATAALPDAEIARWPATSARTFDYALVWKPPAELLRALRAQSPRPRAIFNLGAGVDALLAMPDLPGDVPIVRLEDTGMAIQMVEYVTLAVLAEFRDATRYRALQREARWEPLARRSKADFAIGLLGLGVLGTAVAAALAPLGFALHGWSRRPRTLPGVRTYAGLDELAAFLARSRVLVCLLPSTPHTRDLLDRRRLLQLPHGASLVNVARGDIVVEEDLLAVLDAGHLSQATLDVFRTEPLPAGHPFWHHPKVTITPHSSAVTLPAESVGQVAAKIRRLEQGLAITGIVDRALGY